MSDWTAEQLSAQRGDARRFRVLCDGSPMSFAQVAQAWIDSADFCVFFSAQIAASNYTALFWETPPVTRSTLDQAFEFVLVDSPSLAGVTAQARAFSQYFQAAGSQPVTTFANLGGDGTLIAPVPTASGTDHAHLASFLRSADNGQSRALWQAVAEAALQRLTDKPLWISTSGLGVYWLHVRLDTRPKYYTYAPYRNPAYRPEQE